MHSIVKYIVFAIILLAFILLFIPKYKLKEPFASELGEIMADINKDNKFYSTILYLQNKNSSEEDYLSTFNTTHPISSLNEPLIMNRCIQFINDPSTNRGGIDQIIKELYNDKKIFVSDKISFDYVNYNDIELNLQKYLYKLYYETNTNSGQRVEQFYGPAYVLITQYPYIRTINAQTCDVYPTTLQGTPDRYLYSPRPIEDVQNCPKEVEEIKNKQLRLEMYVLLPAHLPMTKSASFNRIVGPFTYKSWAQIRCNMRRLFAYNPTKRAGVSVVNPRSFDEKCTVECLTPTSNLYKYICGARSHTGDKQPYESSVLGTKTVPLRPDEKLLHDYANLYLINSEKMNALLQMNAQKGMFRDCVSIEDIPTDFNTSYNGCDFSVKKPKPSTPQTVLRPLADSTFKINIMNRCLTVDNNKNLNLMDCNAIGFNDRWYLETRRITTEREALYLLYVKINNQKWYLSKNNINAKAILTSTRPSIIAFKPNSEKQLRLVELMNNGTAVNWRSEANFCLTIYENNLIFMSNCNPENTNVTYIPFPDTSDTCINTLTEDEFQTNLSYVRKNLI
jgi:hypothetical protein